MANIRLYSTQAGHVELSAPDLATERRLTLPDEDGVLATREFLTDALSTSAVVFSGLELHSDDHTVTLQPPASLDDDLTLTLPGSGVSLLSDGSPLPASNLTGRFQRQTLPQGSVLQVVQTVFDQTFATAIGAGWASVPQFVCTITPTLPTSKVLVKLDLCFGFQYWHYKVRLTRNGQVVTGALGAQDGSRQRSWLMMNQYSNGTGTSFYEANIGGGTYLDSPGSTAAQTYGIEIGGYSTSYSVYINRTHSNYNQSNFDARPISTLTLMEVAA